MGLVAAEVVMEEGAMIEADMIGGLLVVDTVVATEVDPEAMRHTRGCVGEKVNVYLFLGFLKKVNLI